MTKPITPPPKLVQQWSMEAEQNHQPTVAYSLVTALATRAAQWGADQELEACIEWIAGRDWTWTSAQLRTARRPKPPSLKEQAIAALSEMSIEPCLINDVDVNAAVCAKYNTIRRALEALDD